MENDIRSKQRFAHFLKAYEKYAKVVDLRDMSELEEAGFVQRFEFALELAWKTLRDYLLEEGFSPASPKETIRQAYESGYIEEAQIWMDMIDLRNTFSHDYDGSIFHEREMFLREDAFRALSFVVDFFKKKYG